MLVAPSSGNKTIAGKYYFAGELKKNKFKINTSKKRRRREKETL